jgi:hypothetical protein
MGTEGEVITYANDTYLLFSSDTRLNVKSKATPEVNTFFNELSNLKLTLNINESKFAAISIDKTNVPFDDITMNVISKSTTQKNVCKHFLDYLDLDLNANVFKNI